MRDLSDDQLLFEVKTVASRDRDATAQLIASTDLLGMAITLTTVCLLASHLNDENHRAIGMR